MVNIARLTRSIKPMYSFNQQKHPYILSPTFYLLHSISYIPPKAPSGGPRRFCGVMTRGGAAFGVFQLNNRCVRHGLGEAVSLDSPGICGVSWVL